MKRFLLTLLIVNAVHHGARAQDCYGDLCYPQQPGTRLVLPLEPQASVPHDAHCRIIVGDGSVGSGTLIAKNDATGLIVTCSHLFDSAATNVVVVFPDGGRFGARLIDRDPANDLAALLIKTPTAKPLDVNDDEPTGVLTACGYGASGLFRPVRGAIAGAVQAVVATYPSFKITTAVRPGDSGGGVLDSAGRLVGVVWGCRDGETYLTCGRPLRNFLDRVWRGRSRAGSSTTPDQPGPRPSAFADGARGPARQPTVDWQTWRTDTDARLAALDAKKQDRSDYLQTGDLNGYAKTSELATTTGRIEERINTLSPGLFSGLSFGKLIVGTLGLSGPVAAAVMIAGGLIGRRIKRRIPTDRGRGRPGSLSTPIAVDSPPPPQQVVPESHYVPVERDDFARAHQWAREQVARKYPGATEVLATLESLIKQQLAASTN